MSQGSQKKSDIVFVHGPAKDGKGVRVIRAREDRVEVGEISQVEEGAPLKGEVVKLKQRKEHPRLFDVEVVVPKEDLALPAHEGPRRVSSDSYRRNWDEVFGAGRPRKQLLN